MGGGGSGQVSSSRPGAVSSAGAFGGVRREERVSTQMTPARGRQSATSAHHAERRRVMAKAVPTMATHATQRQSTPMCQEVQVMDPLRRS